MKCTPHAIIRAQLALWLEGRQLNTGTPRPFRRPGWALLSLLAIVLLGAALRFGSLGRVPAGLYQDEAFNGLDALDVLAGSRSLYFPANHGREPLFIYLVAASVGTLGRTALAVRLPAAVLGVLTIPAVYAFGRKAFNQRVALLAAFVTATTFWPVALSRTGFRAVALPCVIALALAAAWPKKPAEGRPPAAGLPWGLALGGALYGLSFYTYLAVRFTPLALLYFGGYLLLRQRSAARSGLRRVIRSALPRSVFFLIPSIVVVFPLGVYAAVHPDLFLGRAGQVSIFNPAISGGDEWGTLVRHSLSALGMFFWRGDTIARHNLPGRPVFDPLMGLAFSAGVWVCLRRFRRDPAATLCLIGVGIMLLPTALAEDTPHFLRGVGVWPMLALLPALGLDAGYGWMASRARRLVGPLLGLALASSAGLTVRDYFGRYANDPVTRYYFQSAVSDLAADIQSGRQEKATLYLDLRFWDQFASLRFLLLDWLDLRLFKEGQPLVPAQAPKVTLFVWPYDEVRPSLGALPTGAVIEAALGPLYRGDLEPAAYSLYSRYTATTKAATVPALGCFELEICLESAEIGQPNESGETLIELTWLANSPPARNLHVFVHAYAGDEQIGGGDGPGAGGLYPTDWWRAGDRVREVRQVDGVGPDPNAVWRIGLYDPVSGERLRRSDAPLEWVEIGP